MKSKTDLPAAAPLLKLCLLCGAFLAANGCKTASPSPKPTDAAGTSAHPLMSPTARAEATELAAAHPPYKLFLQKIDLPTILVVAESTTDDRLKSLLWFLRTEVRSGHFKALGLRPTATTFDRPGYASGIFNVYRGSRCAPEMYTPAGRPDPCGPSIHKSADYHWGDAGNPRNDEADLVTPAGATLPVFDATDGWQTEDEARTDPDGSHARAAAARIQYAGAQSARQAKQRTDLRFSVGQPPAEPDTQLSVVSYQLATEDARMKFLRDFLTLEQDHLCAAAFQTIALGIRGSPGQPYPIPCAATH